MVLMSPIFSELMKRSIILRENQNVRKITENKNFINYDEAALILCAFLDSIEETETQDVWFVWDVN